MGLIVTQEALSKTLYKSSGGERWPWEKILQLALVPCQTTQESWLSIKKKGQGVPGSEVKYLLPPGPATLSRGIGLEPESGVSLRQWQMNSVKEDFKGDIGLLERAVIKKATIAFRNKQYKRKQFYWDGYIGTH